VEPIEIRAFEEMEYLSRGSYLLFVSAKARMTEPKERERESLSLFLDLLVLEGL
jgi:hypothetical protein